jgi:hypothetical protein
MPESCVKVIARRPFPFFLRGSRILLEFSDIAKGIDRPESHRKTHQYRLGCKRIMI